MEELSKSEIKNSKIKENLFTNFFKKLLENFKNLKKISFDRDRILSFFKTYRWKILFTLGGGIISIIGITVVTESGVEQVNNDEFWLGIFIIMLIVSVCYWPISHYRNKRNQNQKTIKT